MYTPAEVIAIQHAPRIFGVVCGWEIGVWPRYESMPYYYPISRYQRGRIHDVNVQHCSHS
jgi:hypothetical protein